MASLNRRERRSLKNKTKIKNNGLCYGIHKNQMSIPLRDNQKFNEGWNEYSKY